MIAQHKIFLLLILLVSVFPLAGQIKMKGTVLALPDKKPIPYANIGIENSNIGTLSNEDGTFSINIPDQFKNDTLLFSALGYSRKSIAIAQWQNKESVDIALSEMPIVLAPVTVEGKRQKNREYELGNRFSKGGVNLCSDPESASGASVALLMDNRYPSYYKDFQYPVHLKSARLRIDGNSSGNFKVRIRLYDRDSLTGLPGSDLLNESVIVNSDLRQGWINFDLSAFNLRVTRPFFVAFEWILDKKDRQSIALQYREFERDHPERVKIDTTVIEGQKVSTVKYFDFLPGTSFGVSLLPFSLNNYKCFRRNNSLGDWKRAAFILTARILVGD